MESVAVLNNGTSLEVISSDKDLGNDYEISFSVSNILFDIDGDTSLRIPLINIIIISNVLLCVSEDIPLNKTTISCTINVINPSLFSTINQLFSLIEKYEALHSGTGIKSSQKTAHVNPVNLLITDINELPSFRFQLTLSDFTSTLQISDEENVIFKIFNIHSLLTRNNGTIACQSKAIIPMQKQIIFDKEHSAEQNTTNYVKIVGATLDYLKVFKTDGVSSLSVPIYGFERLDTFLDNISLRGINIQSTLRHSHVTLNDLRVLETLQIVISKIHKQLKKATSSATPNKTVPMETAVKNMFKWCLRLRLKDSYFSLLVAKFLPTILDPLEIDGFNLTDVDRGLKILLDECIFTINPQEKRFEIIDASVIRVMDNQNHESLSDDILKLFNLTIAMKDNIVGYINLPTIQIKFDTNLIWLAFYLYSIVRHFRPKDNHPISPQHSSSIGLLSKFDLGIAKVFISITLPKDVPLLFSIENVRYSPENKLLSIPLITAYVQSIYVKTVKIHVALMTIRDFIFDVGYFLNHQVLRFQTSLLYFHTEYHFRFYMIVDNIITMFKSFKQIKLACIL